MIKFYRPILKLNRLLISIELTKPNDKYINSHIIYQMFNNRPNNIFGAVQNNQPLGQPQNNNVFGNNNAAQGNIFGNRSTYLIR